MTETVIYNFEKNRYEKVENFQGLLFHHIPKTAGSTFRGILENMFLEEEVCRAEIPEELKSFSVSELQEYKLVAGHFSYQICDDILEDKIWITFLRTPVDRIISYYYNLIDPNRMPDTWKVRFRNRSDWREFLHFIRCATFKEFLYSTNEKAKKIVNNRQIQAFIPDDIRTQIEDWGIYNEKLVELAKQNLKEKFVFVGIQEYFDLSLDLFSATFALSPIDATNYTTNLNTKKTKDTKYDLDEDILAIVREKNQMDLELYEYAKELFFERMHKINKSILWQNRIETLEVMSNIKPTNPQHFNIEDVYSTHGFYAIENTANKAFRWSGYQTPSIIEFIYKFKKNKLYKIEIDLINIIDNSILPSVNITLNDIPLKHKFQKKLLKRKYNTVVCEILSDDIDWYRTIHSLKIFSDLKKEGSYKGARNLGLAISHIRVKEI